MTSIRARFWASVVLLLLGVALVGAASAVAAGSAKAHRGAGSASCLKRGRGGKAHARELKCRRTRADRIALADPAAVTVSITHSPASPTTSTSASISWTTSGQVTNTICTLGGSSMPCGHSLGYSGLKVGLRSFKVQVFSASDSASASVTWTITPPTTTTTTTTAPTTTTTTTAPPVAATTPGTTTTAPPVTATTPGTTTTAPPVTATTPGTTTPAPPVTATTPGTTTPAATTSSSGPFLATGPWTTPTPAYAPLDPNSSAIVANLVNQVQTTYGHVALNTSSYSAPIYTVPADQPTVNMSWNNCQRKSYEDQNFAADLQNVPIPANALVSGGSDAEIVIYQPSTDIEWEFWRAADTNGTWSACWGGRIQNVSQNPGVFDPGFGDTASGLPLLGSLVRVSDLESGSINHAVDLEVPMALASAFSWPANRTDGSSLDPTAPAEGERFRLPASLDLSTLHLSAGELMIAKAMQTYGAIVTDTSGAVSMQAEDPRPYMVSGAPNPYASFFTGPSSNWLTDIPWQDLQAVAWNYGEPTS
jgi:hypothetical protein